MNIIDVPINDQGVVVGGVTLPLSRSTCSALSAEGAKRATFGFRPESVEIVGAGEGFPFEVVVVEELGSDAYAYGNLQMHDQSGDGLGSKLLTVRVDARRPPAKGEVIHLRIRSGEAHVFSAETGRRVSQDEH